MVKVFFSFKAAKNTFESGSAQRETSRTSRWPPQAWSNTAYTGHCSDHSPLVFLNPLHP